MKYLVLAAVAAILIALPVSAGAAHAGGKTLGEITVTPGVDSRHFTVSGCGFKPLHGNQNQGYVVALVGWPAPDPITEADPMADFVVGDDGCGTATVDATISPAGDYGAYISRYGPTWPSALSNIVQVTIN